MSRFDRLGRALLLTAACGVLAAPVHAQIKAVTPDAKPAQASATAKTEVAPDAMMAEMMKLAQPGPQHKALGAMVGSWKAVTRSWNGPGEPVVSEGAAENRMILGGRYLESRFTSTMMNQPFEGYGLTGYDNQQGRYDFFWVDNMSTGMMTSSGMMDAAGKVLTTTSSMPGPDGKPQDVKMVTKIVSEDQHVFSMYGMTAGKEQLMMEITYTRK